MGTSASHSSKRHPPAFTPNLSSPPPEAGPRSTEQGQEYLSLPAWPGLAWPGLTWGGLPSRPATSGERVQSRQARPGAPALKAHRQGHQLGTRVGGASAEMFAKFQSRRGEQRRGVPASQDTARRLFLPSQAWLGLPLLRPEIVAPILRGGGAWAPQPCRQ